jgi:CHAD domain-containing protein
MAFQLRSNESVSDGLQRLARKELRCARSAVDGDRTPNDDAIHEARKSVKKVRAILQLIEDDGGRGLGRSEKRLRSVNRTLSELRDAAAMIETLAALRKRHPRLFSRTTFAQLRRKLVEQKRDATKEVEDGGWKEIERQLQLVRRTAKGWRPAHRDAGALARGIRAAHRRGRKAMKCAQRDHRAENFHAWRKAIKALWYTLRLVEAADAKVRRDIQALHLAEQWLGEDHNIVVLCQQLARDAAVCRDPPDLDRLRLVADRDQLRLREKTIAKAKTIYQRAPASYAHSVARAWKR